MLDKAECIAELDSTSESVKVMKVFNFEEDINQHQNGDVEMKDDATTNASPDTIPSYIR